MKRTGRLERRTPLRANLATTMGWQRKPRKPLPFRSAKKQAARPAEVAVRDRVFDRDGGCVMRTVFIGRTPCGGPLTPHHLRKSSAGGTWDDDNVVACCAVHNGWIEDDPPTARGIGLVVRAGITPGEAWDLRVAYGLVVHTERPDW